MKCINNHLEDEAVSTIVNTLKINAPRRILTIEEIIREDCDPIDFLFYPWLNCQGLIMIFAERGVGKTHFAFNMAHAIANGGQFLRGNAPRAQKVLYADGEMQFFALKERMAMANLLFGEPPVNHLFVLTPDKYNMIVPDLATKEGQDIIDKHLEETGAKVLFIDNVATLMRSLIGNDNDMWAKAVQPWLLELRRRGISVVIVHHAGKSKNGEAPTGRGASGKEDALDTVILLTRPNGYTPQEGARFNVEFTKARHFHGEDAEKFEAWLKEDEQGQPYWFIDNVKDSTYNQVCQLTNNGVQQKDIAKKLRITRQRVSYLVGKGVKEGIIIKIVDQFSPKKK